MNSNKCNAQQISEQVGSSHYATTPLFTRPILKKGIEGNEEKCAANTKQHATDVETHAHRIGESQADQGHRHSQCAKGNAAELYSPPTHIGGNHATQHNAYSQEPEPKTKTFRISNY